MNRLLRAGLCLTSLILVGCTSDAELAADSTKPLRPGMPLGQAVAAMQAAHFTCLSTANGGFDCERMRPFDVIATCIQRVYLHPGQTGDSPATVDLPRNSCTSL